MASVGIIANPYSGKDIRRLVAHGEVSDNHSKLNIIRRILIGVESVGVDRVLYMPDPYNLVRSASDGIDLSYELRPLEMRFEAGGNDSIRAGALMREAEVGCVITLGGDGTNRVVAKGWPDAPLMPVSTGTNNVFPVTIEGTLAGMAAALVAGGQVRRDVAMRRSKRLEVAIDGEATDIALVDVAVSAERMIAARAIWRPTSIKELILTCAAPGSLGLSSIGAHLDPIGRQEPVGVHLKLADDGIRPAATVLAPIGPGLVESVSIAGHQRLEIGETVRLGPTRGTLAYDGEREQMISPAHAVDVTLTLAGPYVVDATATLGAAAEAGVFVRPG